ncbi:sigma-70 family RNA polymerase sigma factor [Cellulomonas sp. zg-ZUI199]|uniref:Sigma-70 family RNA polymerase sigma factor n=1 Tax=Cellulomonas wangleii TaxID=2816956 RepID=A0ABX8D5U4_9CELL|nr:sigma-70 family RNA polymerase sigma factor [Cellulomonas wangleii]MBO0926325.1 sigma-70 family RNA polymerase sigma factor [Cellulomonas wangleii]QVI62826.1 sigma-70 family RNA polymerase sigma factor [Cellulomonas wangleii]
MSDSDVVEDDAALLRATRTGDSAAFGRLYERHAGAALVVARQYTDSTPDAEDVVADAFANVHRALLGGNGPDAAFRAYLFTVVRRVAAVQRTAGRRAQPTDDVATLETASAPVAAAEEPTLAGFERGVVARAFRSLPERWREVLWHSEVEGLTPAQIAPIVGLSANSTAALAYRAREGLRQAYLQHHLQDPLDEGCRSVAGKLGAHVRGGLAARDTRQVETHLDECGECRALVLELGDVNHGMRAVVAPLVLGLLGLGALAHDLPVGGGLAAGAAALGQAGGAGASGGAGSAGSGAGASGGAGSGGAGAGGAGAGAVGSGGAGAVGAGAGGVAATGAVGTVTGASAAVGGATAATAATGAAGLLGGVSAGAVALVAAAALVVTVVVAAAVLLVNGPDVLADPTPSVSGAAETRPTAPAPRATSSSTPAPVPTSDPTPDTDDGTPDDASPGDASPDGRDGTVPGRGPAAAPPGAPAPVTPPGSRPVLAPPAGPAPGAEPEPGPGPAPDPDPEQPPPPGPADVVVVVPEGGIDLAAGVAGQAIELTVRNAGGLPAAALVAEVELPAGVTFQAGALASPGFGFGPVAAAEPVGWTCVDRDGDGAAASCTLPGLDPGRGAVLALRVNVDEGWVSTSGDEAVHMRITGDGRTWEPEPVRVRVAASPARLAFDGPVPTEVQLVTGRARTLTVPVRNAGGTAVTATAPALAELTLPPGVSATAAAPWSCAAGQDGPTVCRHAGLAPFERSTLTLTLTSPSGAATGSGTLHVRLSPAGHRSSETHVVTSSLVRPPVLGVEAPAALDVAPGTPVDLGVTVANTGDLAAAGTSLQLTVPTGATIEDATGEGWACAPAGATATCTTDLAPGARSSVTARVTAAAGSVGALGAATARVSAPDADVPAVPAEVDVTAIEPVLAVTDAAAVVDATRGGTVAFVAAVAGSRVDGRPAADAAGVVATVTLPPGITHDPTAAGPQTVGCAAAGSVVTCPLGGLVAGGSVPVQLQVRAAGAVRGTVDVRVTATGAQAVTTSAQVVVASGNLTPVWSGVGDLDVTEVGAPLLQCVGAYGGTCPAVRQDRDNNGLDMRPLDLVPPPSGARAAVPVSSSTRLTVPGGRPVVWAGLYWSAVRGPADAWSGDRSTARLRSPDGTWTDVTAGSVVDVADSSGRQYYQAAVDVTDLVARGGAGTWALADAAVSAGRSDRDPTYYAGWSLVVVHGTPAAAGSPGASAVTVHQGGAWTGTSTAAPAFAFVGEAGARTRIGVVAWEGDRAASNDRMTLSGVGPLRPLRWDGTATVGGGSAGNAFDSTATGWAHPNSLGVDAKGFEEVTLPTGVGTLTPSTAGDQYLIGVVTVRTAAPPSLQAPQS